MIGVHLLQIPSEGKHIEGTEDAAFLDLQEIEVQAMGPVHYDLDVGVSGGGVFATGSLSVPLKFRCVACLQPFDFTATVDSFAMQMEIEGREFVDFTPAIREELLLALPNHPRCDLNSDIHCPYQRPEASGEGKKRKIDSAWDQLENFKPER